MPLADKRRMSIEADCKKLAGWIFRAKT